MADELEEVLRKFASSEKEATGIQMEGVDVSQCSEECKQSIIGKVIGHKTVNIATM